MKGLSEMNESMTTRDSKGYGKSAASGNYGAQDRTTYSGNGAENLQEPAYQTLTQKINSDLINQSH
jgi:hypothetical protein